MGFVLLQIYYPAGVMIGQLGGVCIVTQILPRWGDAYTYKTACYKDYTTPTESESVVGFVLLQIFCPAEVMIGQLGGVCIVTQILPRWGDASAYKSACYKDHTTPSESESVVGFMMLQRFYPAGVMLGQCNGVFAVTKILPS